MRPIASDNTSRLEGWRDQFAADIIGNHPLLLRLLGQVRRVAAAECDTLLTGASGTGKELIAKAIHRASTRRHKPFVAINCAAIPKELMESEIFGHAKGAFTGATEKRLGKFELANGGTLFLDEIGEMEILLQSKLLRVLQEREVTPVGSAQTVRLDLRIVAATNQNLSALCEEKLFREDLFYRLNVVPLQLPSLAERREDVGLLAAHFIERANHRHGRSLLPPTAAATAAMANYAWPGNIRELHNVVERIAVLKAEEGAIAVSDLPGHIVGLTPATEPNVEWVEPAAPSSCRPAADLFLPEGGVDINVMLTQMETRLTLDALTRSKGNKAKAAELLGLKRTTLVERLKKLQIAHSMAG